MSFKAILIASLAAVSLAVPTPQISTGSSTKNDVVDGLCRPYTLLFARGTTESGNMGSVVGPTLESAIESLVGAGNLATQGIDYAADVSGTVIGSTDPKDATGAKVMAELVNGLKGNCSTTKIILAGYSQGAQQVHGALINLSEGDADAAVTFGDPLESQAFQNIDSSKTKIYCNTGDEVCMDEFIISAAHLAYGTDGSTTKAAQFAVDAVGGS